MSPAAEYFLWRHSEVQRCSFKNVFVEIMFHLLPFILIYFLSAPATVSDRSIFREIGLSVFWRQKFARTISACVARHSVVDTHKRTYWKTVKTEGKVAREKREKDGWREGIGRRPASRLLRDGYRDSRFWRSGFRQRIVCARACVYMWMGSVGCLKFRKFLI